MTPSAAVAPAPLAAPELADAKILRIHPDALSSALAQCNNQYNDANKHVREQFERMSDSELFPIGERAAQNLLDDIFALAEIRSRFKRAKGKPLAGYANWQEFCHKNFTVTIRTVQNRIAAVGDYQQHGYHGNGQVRDGVCYRADNWVNVGEKATGKLVYCRRNSEFQTLYSERECSLNYATAELFEMMYRGGAL